MTYDDTFRHSTSLGTWTCLSCTPLMRLLSPESTDSQPMHTLMTFRSTTTATHLTARRLCHACPLASKWMASSRLRLNASKTELIWLGADRYVKLCPTDPQLIAGATSLKVRDLGVMVDTARWCTVDWITALALGLRTCSVL